MNQFLVYCPKGIRTGGPEALHQLTEMLCSIGKKAAIVWYGDQNNEDAFPEYDVPKEATRVRTAHDVAVVPEVRTDILKSEDFHKKAVFWLSVDNYSRHISRMGSITSFRGVRSRIKKRRHFSMNKPFAVDYHLYQSEYAKLYLLSNLRSDYGRLYEVSDYLRSPYVDSAKTPIKKDRNNWVAYNPRKIGDFGASLIDSLPVDMPKPIVGLDAEGVYSLLSNCKVYIDFGHHPGKDRIPREAGAAGCLVLVGDTGSASFYKDVPIPAEYKLDLRTVKVEECVNQIGYLMENYEAELSSIEKIRSDVSIGYDNFFYQVKRWVDYEGL